MTNIPLGCDHDWEDIGVGKQQCTYPDCQVVRSDPKGCREEVKGQKKCCNGGPHSGHEYSCHYAFEF